MADGQVSRALVVTAHPDDVDYGAGATVASWVSAGITVAYCVCTDGDNGGFDPAVPRSEIPGIRQAEQRAAAKELGVTDVTFLGYPDGQLEASYAVRRDISRVIRRVRPQRVLLQSPDRNYDRLPASHPDHLAAGTAALAAVYPDARNPFAHPELLAAEGLAPWSVSELWLMGGPDAATFIDITDTVPAMLAALRAHVSQTAHEPDLESRVRGWLADTAQRGGLPSGRLAQAFRVAQVP